MITDQLGMVRKVITDLLDSLIADTSLNANSLLFQERSTFNQVILEQALGLLDNTSSLLMLFQILLILSILSSTICGGLIKFSLVL